MVVKFIECNNLRDIKTVRHGFFKNHGGVSSGIYASLNCGVGSNDALENVLQNRTLAMNALGFSSGENLYSLYQVHSDKVVRLTEVPAERLEADGMVTNVPGIGLGILTADCTPILFSDGENGVIGACHAGWKGAIGGVIENTILEMEKIGAARGHIIAAIGPTISQKSYEVGPEFHARFASTNSDYTQFFIPSKKPGHFRFDLPGFVAHRLQVAGVLSIENSGYDTCADRENFFSYRRNCLENISDYGRNLSAIILK